MKQRLTLVAKTVFGICIKAGACLSSSTKGQGEEMLQLHYTTMGILQSVRFFFFTTEHFLTNVSIDWLILSCLYTGATVSLNSD